MAGINKAIILGRLGQDPEMKSLPNGDPVVRMSLATSNSWTDKQTNEKVQRTEWHTVIAFRNLAEIIGLYLKKGSQVYIEGELRTRKWQAQDGTDRYTTEIIASKMEMCGGSQSCNNWAQESKDEPVNKENSTGKPDPLSAMAEQGDRFDDNIPF